VEFVSSNSGDLSSDSASNSTETTTANTSTTHKTQSASINLSLEGEFTSGNSFKLDSYLMWANFELFPLDSQSFEGFLAIYATLGVIFYVFLIFLFTAANGLFRASMMDEIKDSTQFAVKVCSVIMALYIFVL